MYPTIDSARPSAIVHASEGGLTNEQASLIPRLHIECSKPSGPPPPSSVPKNHAVIGLLSTVHGVQGGRLRWFVVGHRHGYALLLDGVLNGMSVRQRTVKVSDSIEAEINLGGFVHFVWARSARRIAAVADVVSMYAQSDGTVSGL